MNKYKLKTIKNNKMKTQKNNLENIVNPIQYSEAVKYIVKEKQDDFWDSLISGEFTTYDLNGDLIETKKAIELGKDNVFFETEQIKDWLLSEEELASKVNGFNSIID